MKQFLLCLLVIIAIASGIQARPAPVEPKPADHSIENVIPVNLFDDIKPVETPKPEATKPKTAYELAYAAAQESGKLTVLVCAEWCKPCKDAKEQFAKLSDGRLDCVQLDYDLDPEAKSNLDGRVTLPTVLVFQRRESGWYRLTYDGTSANIKQAFSLMGTDPNAKASGNASFAPECLGCQNCPAECAARGCHCGSSCGSCSESGSEHAGCGGACLVRGQPVRNALKLGGKAVVKTAKAGAALWPTNPLTGKKVGAGLLPRNWPCRRCR